MDSFIKRFFKYWLPPIIWAGVIFYFSSIPSLRSPFPDIWDLILRKGAHLVEYAILAILFLRLGSRQEKKRGAVIVVTLLACLFYAVLDEYHQSFVIGRGASGWDVLVDEIGAGVGILIFLF